MKQINFFLAFLLILGLLMLPACATDNGNLNPGGGYDTEQGGGTNGNGGVGGTDGTGINGGTTGIPDNNGNGTGGAGGTMDRTLDDQNANGLTQ